MFFFVPGIQVLEMPGAFKCAKGETGLKGEKGDPVISLKFLRFERKY